MSKLIRGDFDMDIRQLHDYQQILDASSDLIYWKDNESNYLGCNRHILYATRMKKIADIIGKSDYELAWAQFSELYRADDKKALANEIVSEVEPLVVRDRIILADMKKYPLYDGDQVIGVMGYSKPLTNINLSPNSPINNKLLSDHFFGITERESHVLFFAIRGLSAKRIATLLDLSPRTVEQYCTNLKNKFGCLSKDELIRRAYGLGFDKVRPERLSPSLIHEAFCLAHENH